MTETGRLRERAGSCRGCPGCGSKAPSYRAPPRGGGGILVQALTALLPPFLGFVAGYMVVPSGSQALRAAAGCAGLFIAAGVVYFIRKYLPWKRQP
ncbi:MAG: hypothetical protein LBL19_02540 [Spirochaetaceae bacterium]|jgi:hypothetical protein|nr:hypothetical protein [Spirochaetaceae bacterium]